MKKAFVIGSLLALASCAKVEPGYIGIKVYMLGGSKGVDHEVLGVGRYWIGVNEHLYTFPVFQQNYNWTKSHTEGSPTDESITFQTKEGMAVNADFGISYSIDPAKVSTLFQKYRKGIDEITNIFLRNAVRDSINEVSSTMSVEEVYGEKKAYLLKTVQEKVSKEVKEIGVNIDKIYLIGEMRLPSTVLGALNAKIQATQDALRVKNEVEQAKAQAEKEIAIAEGVAKANHIKASSLSDNLIRWEAVQKWDGKLPQVSSSSGIFPFLNVGK